MPIVEFDERNKIVSAADFPKFKLEKDEYARIVCLENPLMEWVHEMRAPKIVNGEPQMETRKRRDDTEYQDYAMDFMGRPLCLGDLGILQDRGVDGKNCPVCKAAGEGDIVTAPSRRFAMHIIRYGTKPGSYDLRDTFTVETLVWPFAERYYNKLLDLKTEWGNLQQRDLNVKCTVKAYQNFDIGVAARAEWLVNDERKKLTASTFKKNRAADLTVFIGRKSTAAWLLEDLQKIKDRWRIANGVVASAPLPDLVSNAGAVDSSLAEGLDDLLNTVSSPAVQQVATPVTVDIADLLADVPSIPAPQPVAQVEQAPQGVAEPVAQVKPAPVAPKDVNVIDPFADIVVETPPSMQRLQPDKGAPVEELVQPTASVASPTGETVSFDDLLNLTS